MKRLRIQEHFPFLTHFRSSFTFACCSTDNNVLGRSELLLVALLGGEISETLLFPIVKPSDTLGCLETCVDVMELKAARSASEMAVNDELCIDL